jgi:hypothetical protein
MASPASAALARACSAALRAALAFEFSAIANLQWKNGGFYKPVTMLMAKRTTTTTPIIQKTLFML